VVKASVIILTWNSQQVVDACLSSLAGGLSSYPFEVIVVDNGSHDQTLTILRERYPWVRVLCNEVNRGVAPARNQGIQLASGEYLILLDDDTVVQPGALDRLIAYMESAHEVGLCGPQLRTFEGHRHLSCRLFPTLSYKFVRRLPVAFARRLTRAVEMADWDHATIREVDYVIGACQIIRRTALLEVGLLDERIFYGPEDVDLCLRLHKAGWRVVYNPEAVVLHTERRVTRSLFSFLGRQHLRGLLYYFWKHGYWFSRRRLYAQLPARTKTPRSTRTHPTGAPTFMLEPRALPKAEQ
jgi:GT2 family glycosyltransferase